MKYRCRFGGTRIGLVKEIVSVTVFSDERSMPIEKVRKSGIVAIDEVTEISRWISD